MAEQKESVDTEIEGGDVYELIRKRLSQQGSNLADKVGSLNQQRQERFSGSEFKVLGGSRVRTENNCVPRDIVCVGDTFLLAYNVFIGLKTEIQVSDVFSIYRFDENSEGLELENIPLAGTYLDDDKFKKDFLDLYKYYKESKLAQLRRGIKGKLLALFQTGSSLDDQRVFRWSVTPDGAASYIDARGEGDNVIPPSHDFEWTFTTRDDHVRGKHAHINILDTVFVETIEGDLTVKVENNTEDGKGIYSEPVEDLHQSLQDAQIAYARVGKLILMKIRPYQEKDWRYLVYNTLTQSVDRIDQIGHSCVELPEDHGIIFPGGYYLQNGEKKVFDADVDEMYFLRKVRSPNGEDVLYVFYHREDGRFALLSYNMIRKELENPIFCHGYGLLDDGRLVMFRSTSEEPTRVHSLQFWQTPYVTDEFAAKVPKDDSFMGRIGNAELVRAISDIYSICRMIDSQRASMAVYEEMIAALTRISDTYHWLDAPETGRLLDDIKTINSTIEQVLDEFEKVETVRGEAVSAVNKASERQDEILRAVRAAEWTTIDGYVDALDQLRQQRGRLISLRDLRYVDTARVVALEDDVAKATDRISDNTVKFLLGEAALKPYTDRIDESSEKIEKLDSRTEMKPIRELLTKTGDDLNLLTDVVNQLAIDDATVRTRILESITKIFSRLNQVKANADIRWKSLGKQEDIAEFGAQFALLGQNITSALGNVNTPDQAEEQLSRLLLQLEELEGRFGEHEKFAVDLAEKREEMFSAFESRKQIMVEERQRRAKGLADAGKRIINGLIRRAKSCDTLDELNAFFVSDSMAQKIRTTIEQLRELNENVRADDLSSQIKAAQDQAVRSLRDRLDIFDESGNVIQFGRHRFSVNSQELELAILPDGDDLVLSLTGTDYQEVLSDPELEEYKPYWQQLIVSETDKIYRSEYLAWSIFDAALKCRESLTLEKLSQAIIEGEELNSLVSDFARSRYEEAYEKGVHDSDGARILEKLVHLYKTAGLLRFSPMARSLAMLFWVYVGDEKQKKVWAVEAAAFGRMESIFGANSRIAIIKQKIAQAISCFIEDQGLEYSAGHCRHAADYLVETLRTAPAMFQVTRSAQTLKKDFSTYLERQKELDAFSKDLKSMADMPGRLRLVMAWLHGYVEHDEKIKQAHQYTSLEETATIFLAEEKLKFDDAERSVTSEVDGLFGQHARIQERKLVLNLPEFMERLEVYVSEHVPNYKAAREFRNLVLERERKRLSLDDYQPQMMTSFVRNQLINEVYLPIVGDNLSKQMGTVGDDKRTDLMGLLLLISPPGYGKTTLMEYIANRLGLVFMKINCPTIGHSVVSLDPQEAPNAAARKELVKLNLALEMGNNVMLYLDDIQHSNPEFLQKFISLCDAQRKIEGVWKGEAKAYDLRGKKFAVIMAGNPYTESGEQFQIPDMLANRADVYNLGDMLSGNQEVFELSYIENAMTSNAVLAPLATREMDDFYKLVRMAQGRQVAVTELKHNYSSAQVNEIKEVLIRLFEVRNIVLKVNQQYIKSAAQDDDYRTEPPFRLQGSYRNMNRMAEKVVAVMNEAEVQSLIDDHYISEAQTLTTGAEENLLKLAAMRGNQSEEQQARWESICSTYQRRQSVEGEDDPAVKVATQINGVSQQIESLALAIAAAADKSISPQEKLTQTLDETLAAIKAIDMNVKVVNEPVPGLKDLLESLANTIDSSLLPVVKAMEHKLRLDHDIWDTLHAVVGGLKKIDKKAFAEIEMNEEVRGVFDNSSE